MTQKAENRKEKINLLTAIANGSKSIDELNYFFAFQWNREANIYEDINSSLKLTVDGIESRFKPDKWNYSITRMVGIDGIEPFSIWVFRK